MNEIQVPFRVAPELAARIVALVPLLASDPDVAICRSPSRNTAYRIAALRGVKYYEKHLPTIPAEREYRRDRIRITLRLPSFLVRRIDGLAAATGADRSAVLRRALKVGAELVEGKSL